MRRLRGLLLQLTTGEERFEKVFDTLNEGQGREGSPVTTGFVTWVLQHAFKGVSWGETDVTLTVL